MIKAWPTSNSLNISPEMIPPYPRFASSRDYRSNLYSVIQPLKCGVSAYDLWPGGRRNGE